MSAQIAAPAPSVDRRSARLGRSIVGATSAAEALSLADLDWGLKVIEAEALTVLTDDGVISTSIPGQRMVMRDDNHVTLGVVGGRYTPIMNHSVFALTEHIRSQGGVYTEGGALDHGRRVFMRMGLPGTDVSLLNGRDLVNFGVSVRAAHDGTGNVTAEVVGTRLVCTNGMVAAIPGIPHVFKVRHTASAEMRMAEAETILAGAHQYAKAFAATAQHMLDTPMTRSAFEDYIDRLFPRPLEPKGRAVTTWEARRDALVRLFTFAETNDLGRDTAWGAYNAVTEYLDWEAPVRRTQGLSTSESRARRQFDNSTQDVKDLAFATLS